MYPEWKKVGVPGVLSQSQMKDMYLKNLQVILKMF